jgi:hypothetical protein
MKTELSKFCKDFYQWILDGKKPHNIFDSEFSMLSNFISWTNKAGLNTAEFLEMYHSKSLLECDLIEGPPYNLEWLEQQYKISMNAEEGPTESF